MTQLQKCEIFNAMHRAGKAFILPNCWDAASAVMLEQAGFEAIATASAAVSWACGVKDGEGLARNDMLDVLARVCAAVSVPVSADIERGFGAGPGEVGETVARVLKAGAVGINIEDSLGDGTLRAVPDMQARIAAARAAGEAAGIGLVINARVDHYLLGHSGDDTLADTTARAKAWIEAGATCIFIPGVSDTGLMAQLASAIDAPLNMLVMSADMAPLADIEKAGVRRVSTGPRLMQATLGALSGFASSLREHGDFRFLADAPDFGSINNSF